MNDFANMIARREGGMLLWFLGLLALLLILFTGAALSFVHGMEELKDEKGRAVAECESRVAKCRLEYDDDDKILDMIQQDLVSCQAYSRGLETEIAAERSPASVYQSQCQACFQIVKSMSRMQE